MRPFEGFDDKQNPLLERTEGECLATFWHQATPGTTYWRCLLPARYLPAQTIPVRTDDLQEVDGRVVFPRMRGDTAVWQFLGDDLRSRMAFGLKAMYGTRTLMEVDDNYTQAPPKRIGTTWTDHIEDAHTKNGYSYEANRILAGKVDGIIASTDWLADLYSKYNDNVWVCPNSVDPTDWDYPRTEPDGVFRIVYYGGQARMFDTPLVTKALKWAARQPGVEVWTAGVDPKDWSFPRQHIPWTYDLVAARKPLFGFDLGIAPLTTNPFTRAKSDVKVLEYAMAGVCPLVSRVEAYRPWFDVAPDLVVEDRDDWTDAIRWAVMNQDDVKARAADIKAHVLKHRTIQDNVYLWREAING